MKRSPRLNPDSIDVLVTCHACRTPLWRMKILQRAGDRVVSSEFIPVSKDVPHFKDTITDCPICHREFFVTTAKGEHRYFLRDPHTGYSYWTD